MGYDDETDPMDEPIEGPSAPEPAGNAGFRITIEASQWDETRISNAVLERVTQNIAKKLEQAVSQQLATAVDAAVARVLDGKILAEAERVLTEGWQVTDTYGRSTGQKVTFPDRVHQLLTKSNSYGGQSSLEKLIESLVDKALNKELKPEIDAAKLKVQELLNGTLSAKLLQAMKEGVGLR